MPDNKDFPQPLAEHDQPLELATRESDAQQPAVASTEIIR